MRIRYSFIYVVLLCLGSVLPALTQQCPRLSLPANNLVIADQRGDVTGDGVADWVFLTGDVSTPGSDFAATHALVLRDGASGASQTLSLGPESGGYDGTLFLGRFDPDRVPDIFVAIPTGGSGGTSTYYLLTARGGQFSQLLPSTTLTAGPAWQITLEENYRTRIVAPLLDRAFTINLPRDAELYRGVYDRTGHLLRPVMGTADPYGVLDPVDVNRDGLYELIGYQQLWAIAHVNTIAIARSVWHWTPQGLAVYSVDIVPFATPESYAQELTQLERLTGATAVPRAIARYRQLFSLAPPLTREAAFQQFRAFHTRLITRADAAFHRQTLAIEQRFQRTRQGSPFQEITELASTFNANPANRTAGLAAVYQGEGYWIITARRGFYLENFGQFLSPAYRDYLALEDRETHELWAMDAGLVISLTALGQRVRDWEAYLERYPNSPFRTEAERYYNNQLTALLIGVNNTPHFAYDTGQMRPGVADIMQQYVERNMGTASARQVAQVLDLYARENYHMSPTLRTKLDTLRQSFAPDRAVNYFPASKGASWTYATGGAENAGYHVDVTSRQGNQATLRTTDTASQTTAVYELRPTAVVGTLTGEGTTRHDVVLLQQPLAVGKSWTSGGMRHVIRAVDQTVTVLGRPYLQTIEVVRTPIVTTDHAYEIHDFYSLGVGLVKSQYISPALTREALLCDFRLPQGQ